MKISLADIIIEEQNKLFKNGSNRKIFTIAFIILGISLLIVLAMFIQHEQYSNEQVACGGEWNYICPIGTYCKPIERGNIIQGTCQSYLSNFFNKHLPKKSTIAPTKTPLLNLTTPTPTPILQH